jgi:hypothetical protein
MREMIREMMKIRLMVGLVLAAALISGCGGGPAPLRGEADDRTILLERAQVYWEARFVQDMQKAFAFEDPIRRKRLSLNQYIRLVGEPGKVYAVAVKGATILGDQADVEVEMKTRPLFGPWAKSLLTSSITDDWQKIDGVWYHVLDLHMIRDGKPRVNVERGTIDYPPAAKPGGGSGSAESTDAAAEKAPLPR